ncbi:MAG: GntR family transcriptional regulator [Anaerolineales bacterium]|jgi:DNA-binding GntR family transcriptional regulator|nr:GntR family transcriptional regulator [Anaerolineales bacterium]
MALNIDSLERSNLAERVADLLRESIVNGQISTGTHLIEAEIAKQLNVSRGPLREAFRILETEGLLESHPGRGTYVSQPSERYIYEAYSLRSLLEEEAFKLAIKKRTEEDLNRLENALEELFIAAKSGDERKVLDLDISFHRQIWEIADHRLIQASLEEIITRLKMYIAVQTKIYDDLLEGIGDHKIILEALQNRNEALGIEALRKHLQLAVDMILKYFKIIYNNGSRQAD